MKDLGEISKLRDTTTTISELTRAFEGISSMRISKIKTQVQQSQIYFDELWRIYSQLRVDELFHFGRGQSNVEVINKELLLLITSEGSFSGDVDQRLVKEALDHYKPEANNIVVVGHHGASQLSQRGIKYLRSFKLPSKDININVTPLLAEVQRHASTITFYPTYISLMTQNIKSITLSTAVAELGKSVTKGEDIISEQNYIFEPSTYAVIDHLERSMLQVALSQLILESKLAQYASRFKAMNMAHHKAEDLARELTLDYNRTRRSIKDERIKEIMNGLRTVDR